MKKTICSFSIIVLILHFNLTPVKCENIPYSMIKIYIENKTFEIKSPIDIWFNDSLIISQEVLSNSSAAYKLFSKGNLRITTQIKDFENTRCEYALNIMNEENYVIVIKYESTSVPGSVFGLKKTDGKNYEPYYEENLFQLKTFDEDSIFTDNGLSEQIITHDYSISHLILSNKTFNFDPIKIWINDQLILNQYVLLFSTINCKFFTEGKIKIAAQLGDLINTKAELEFEISNQQSYFLMIKFQNRNKAASITLLNQEEGSELLAKNKLKWTVSEIASADFTSLVESIDNPIPSMYYNTDYRASLEQNIANDRLNLQDDEYFVDSRDGQIYRTVRIGDQVWMAENLRATMYRNGDTIPNIIDNKQWSGDTLGAYCNPNNYIENAAVYGRLYNYYAANDPRGLAPEGWHIATKEDWSNLGYSFPRHMAPGLYMQEIDTIFWSNEMQNINDFTWGNLKIGIRQLGLEEYNKKIDTILSIYQSENNQEIDPGFWEEIRHDRTQINVHEIRIDMLRLIAEYYKDIDTTNATYLKKKELENALVILEQLKHDLHQTYQKKIEIEFLPEVCAEFYENIDIITFIYQKKKETEIYKMKWEDIFDYPMDTMIPPYLTMGIIIPNYQNKNEQRSYVISWKDSKQKNDTIYWNKDVQKLDIIAWYYVKYVANSSGFNALPVGCRVSTGEFSWLGAAAYWLATKANKPNYVGFYSLCDNCFSLNNDMFAFKRKSFGYGIRCVKD